MQPWEDSVLEEVKQNYIKFAQEHLNGDATERDRIGEFSKERWQKAHPTPEQPMLSKHSL